MRAVKDELDRMQWLEVIEPVETPTEWCAGMGWLFTKPMIVSKVVDLTKSKQECVVFTVNKTYCQTLAQFTGAQYFQT